MSDVLKVKVKPEIIFGVEIEANTNTKHTKKIQVGGYHHGTKLGKIKWKVERDSSVENEGEFGDDDNCSCSCYCNEMDCDCSEENYESCDGHCRDGDCGICRDGCNGDCNGDGSCMEFISDVASGKANFKKRLKEFQDYFSDKGKIELKEVMAFNDSCGSHLHFSLKNSNFNFYNKLMSFKILKEVRILFKDKIKKSKIKSKDKIISRYGRSYSSELNESEINSSRFSSGRDREFNFRSELDGLGLEWRSLNMTGIQTWKEFNEFWNIVIECIEFLFNKGTKYTHEFPEEEIKGQKRDKRYLVSKIEIPKINSSENIEVSENIQLDSTDRDDVDSADLRRIRGHVSPAPTFITSDNARVWVDEN